MDDSAGCFTKTVERLPSNWHCVGLDFPGHGDSDFPKNQIIANDLLLGSLVTTINALEWDEFHLVGHSLGGLVRIFKNFTHC